MNCKNIYLITSERACRRDDERDQELYSDCDYSVGDEIVMDGLRWTVTEILRKENESIESADDVLNEISRLFDDNEECEEFKEKLMDLYRVQQVVSWEVFRSIVNGFMCGASDTYGIGKPKFI